MKQRTIVRRKWFWAWQDDNEADWLQTMSQEGLHLKSVSMGIYHFEKGEPCDDIYRLDFQQMTSDTRQEYLSLFEDAGWEHVDDLGNWQYFRIPADSEHITEIHTDPASKIAMYSRIMLLLAATSPAFMLVFVGVLDQFPEWFMIIFGTLYACLMIIYIFAFTKIIGRINRLKNL